MTYCIKNLGRILILIFLTSCGEGGFFTPVLTVPKEKVGNLQNSKLVIGCFISPQDSVITASVTESSPLYSSYRSDSVRISNATVTIEDDQNKSITLKYVNAGFYISKKNELKIIGGHVYKLTVETPDGRKVFATTTVPKVSVPISKINIDSSFVNEPNIGGPIDSTVNYFANIQWQDPLGANFYRVYGVLEQSIEIITDNKKSLINFKKMLYFDENGSRQMLYNDKNSDGKVFQSANGIYWKGKYGGRLVSQNVNVYLFNTDQFYFEYYKSLIAQNNIASDPFSEPISVLSNINGGFGCFSGYNSSKIFLKIK